MTTEADLRAEAQNKRPSESGQESAAPSEPPAIQIKMPGQGGETASSRANPAQPASMDAVENLLRNLLTRLEENDRRYGDALNGLNQRLNDLSQRVAAARDGQPSGSGAALERVHRQAASLAAQVSDAGSGHQMQRGAPSGQFEQRVGGFANDDNPTPDFGDTRLNEDFANVTQRLEKSLASHAPASEFDALSRRMDELGRRFATAVSGQNNAEVLRTIEAQLKALSAGFGEARQNYARVEAIEQHLARLMDWAQSGAAGGDRLDSIEQTLQDLNHNAQEIDTRTVSTLEAMNEVLHSLAAKSESARPSRDEVQRPAEEERSGPPPAAQHAGEAPEPDSEVWFEERTEPEPDHSSTDERMAALEAEIGASIPDYQPSPRKGRNKPASDPRVEPAFEAENDFIASARRAAAAAAAQEPAPPRGRTSGRLLDRIPGNVRPQAPVDPAKPRRILYFIAAGLLAVSAALLYARLKTEAPAPQPIPREETAPQVPGQKPNSSNTPESNSAPRTPDTSDPPARKQSGHVPNTPSVPSAESRQTAQMVQPNIPAAQSKQPTQPRRAAIDPGQPLSTATVLASLSPDAPRKDMPGVTVSIEEPERAPAPRSQNTPRTMTTPALVPPTPQWNAPNPLAPPKRIAAPIKKQVAAAPNLDSARAYEVEPSSAGYVSSNTMPPARIGPNSLRVAAARGHPAAQVEIASRYAKGSGVPKDMKKAAEWYGRAAAQGYAPGQYRLAALHERGQGVKKDIAVARTWYRRAAEQGNVRAMHNLAVLYTRADGQKADYVAARNWFSLAARHGLADSQFNMGILYESGLGTQKNIAEAYKWFTLAARQGDAEAAKRREALRPRLPARSLNSVEKSISNWKSATPKEEANRTGPPRGGWQDVAFDSTDDSLDQDLIKRAQSLLNALGYDAGVPDGKLGPQTEAAVRRFQERSGAKQNGILSRELVQRLEELAS